MRAYLSTGAGHAEDGSRYVCGLNVESAMAEARAILADVEPDRAETACFCIERIAARNCAPNVCTAALAEALAGFIGTEV